MGKIQKIENDIRSLAFRFLPTYGPLFAAKSTSFFLLTLVCGSWLPLLSASGQDQSGDSQFTAQVQTAIESARGQFRPISAEDVKHSRQRLRQELARLELYLNNSGTANAAGWKTFLKWDQLQAEVAAETPNLNKLDEVWRQFLKNEKGLEAKQFITARRAIHDYTYASFFAAQNDLPGMYSGYLDRLSELLKEYEQTPSRETAVQIGPILGWLELAGQAGPLRETAARELSHENLLARASRKLVAAGINSDVSDSQPVRDNILDTAIRGHSTTSGRVTVKFLPNGEWADLLLHLRGQAYSNTVGVNGPATIYSTGVTSINAAARVAISKGGLFSGSAIAECCTDTDTNCVAAKRKIVRRIAAKRVGQSESQAERIAASHAEDRVEASFEQRAKNLVAKAMEGYREQFRFPLERRGEFPENVGFSTSNEHLYFKLLQSTRQTRSLHLGAPGSPPSYSGTNDLVVRLHSSMVGNFSEALLGGETVTDEQLADMYIKANREVPEELRITEDKPPWSITFRGLQPVEIELREEKVKVVIHGDRFTRDSTIIGPMDISAVYELQEENGALKLVRSGDVEVISTSQRPPPLPVLSANQTFLKPKFRTLFKEEFPLDFALPGAWKAAGKLQCQLFRTQNDWLTAAWNLP